MQEFNERIFNQYKIYVEAVKANNYCKGERKAFSIASANPISKYVQPQLARQEAVGLINCFERMLSSENAGQKTKKYLAVESLMNGKDATKLINNYVNS